MNDLERLIQSMNENETPDLRLILADALEDEGRMQESELLRANLGAVRYGHVVHKSRVVETVVQCEPGS